MMNRYDLDLLDIALKCALDNGAKEVIVKLVDSKEYQIRFSNSSIDVAKEWNRYFLDVFVSAGSPFGLGKKINTVTIQDPDVAKIKKRLPGEVKLLKELPRSKLFHGIDSTGHDKYPDVRGSYDNRIENLSERAPELVMNTIDAAEEAGARKVAGVLSFSRKREGLKTNYGNGGDHLSSNCKATIRSFYDDTSSGQSLVVTRDLNNLAKRFDVAGRQSGKLAYEGRGGREGKPGSYDLIMSPTVAANIFGNLLSSTNSLSMIIGMSCLKGKLNDKIAPDSFSVVDDPLIPGGMNSRPFDSEGTPSESTELFKDGVFTGMIHNTSSAKLWKLINLFKLKFWVKAKTTSNSNMGIMGMTGTDNDPRALMPTPSNYVFSPGTQTLDDMISSSKSPTIYMTSNWYTRFTNMREGKFSTVPRDSMFLIRNGEIQGPVRNLRLVGSLLDMVSNIDIVGKDLQQVQWWEVSTPTFIPCIKVKNCKFTAAVQ